MDWHACDVDRVLFPPVSLLNGRFHVYYCAGSPWNEAFEHFQNLVFYGRDLPLYERLITWFSKETVWKSSNEFAARLCLFELANSQSEAKRMINEFQNFSFDTEAHRYLFENRFQNIIPEYRLVQR